MNLTTRNPRQIALLILQDIEVNNNYTDISIDRIIKQNQTENTLSKTDKALISQLVYGIVRRRRSLDALIDSLGRKKAQQQPPSLRRILYLGLYQLRYLDKIPSSAAVNTSVELAKQNKLGKLSGVVNGLLRNYIRLIDKKDPLILPEDTVQKLGIKYSFPDWIVETWLQQLSVEDTEKLLIWFNRSANIDLRVNISKTSVSKVLTLFKDNGITLLPIPHIPQGLRIVGNPGDISKLPGFKEGWWIIQDASAQLVTHLLDPQPNEIIIDTCAAPGGKTTHIAELMQDKGKIIACDLYSKRLNKVRQNARRLELNSIETLVGDSRELSQFYNKCDRVLLDVPCSGLGTLHKRPDIRWRQNPHKIKELSKLQKELLFEAAKLVRSSGTIVYATCTINPPENEYVIRSFLESHPNWNIKHLSKDSVFCNFSDSFGGIKIYPHLSDMDGFFAIKLQKS